MPYRFDRQAHGSRCSLCPLGRKRRIYGISDIDDFRMAIYGEMPASEEESKGLPFVGPAGNLLTDCCTHAGIQRRNAFVSNLVPCRAPGDKLESVEAQQALKCCRPGLEAELEWVKARARVIVALGAKPMVELFGEQPGGIYKMRGSVVDLGKQAGIATFHPSHLLRGAMKEKPTLIQDLVKARELMAKPWKPPRELFNLDPALEDLEALRDRSAGKLIGVDIEATGLNPDRAEIIMIGVAESAERATVIPFWCQHKVPYWSEKDYGSAIKLTREILVRGRIVMANCSYDLPILRRKFGTDKIRAEDDVLLAHHAIHPELPHSLAYVVSLYGKTPYWKGEVSGRTVSSFMLPDKQFRTYNARDCVTMLQVRPGLYEDLKIQGTLFVYREISMKLVEPTIEMTETGLPVDQVRLAAWRRTLKRQLALMVKRFREDYGLPERFNLNSDQHLDLLFHGEVAPQFEKAIELVKEYAQPGTRRKKDSKKYREALALSELPILVQPLRLPLGYTQLKTGTGQWSYDKLSLVKLNIATANRLRLLDNLVRPTEAHRQEYEGLRKLTAFIDLYRKYARTEKLISTYTNFPVWSDGRVHPKYKILGTRTGRLASGSETELATDDDKLNAQNIPEEARKVFVAPPGWKFLNADYSNLELRILAIVAGMKSLQAIFDAGQNVHDVLTRQLFNIDKDHKMWKLARTTEKRVIFGLSYGGGLPKLLDTVTLAVPEFGLTMAQLKAVLENYQAAHPEYFAWRSDFLIKLFLEHPPRLTNWVGRVRLFLGSAIDVEKEALDFPMQSNAADIINRAMIAFHEWRNTQRLRTRLACQVHDSMVLLAPDDEIPIVAPALARFMEAPVETNAGVRSFPVELSVGQSWGELEELNREISHPKEAKPAKRPEAGSSGTRTRRPAKRRVAS